MKNFGLWWGGDVLCLSQSAQISHLVEFCSSVLNSFCMGIQCFQNLGYWVLCTLPNLETPQEPKFSKHIVAWIGIDPQNSLNDHSMSQCQI